MSIMEGKVPMETWVVHIVHDNQPVHELISKPQQSITMGMGLGMHEHSQVILQAQLGWHIKKAYWSTWTPDHFSSTKSIWVSKLSYLSSNSDVIHSAVWVFPEPPRPIRMVIVGILRLEDEFPKWVFPIALSISLCPTNSSTRGRWGLRTVLDRVGAVY